MPRYMPMTAVLLSTLLFSGCFATATASQQSTEHTFGIGFDLSASYGTVAVSYPNGSVFPIAKVEGDENYRKMMVRLNEKSSQHLHKPYSDMAEEWGDTQRRLWRSIRQALGFPASQDVGILSEMMKQLRSEAEKFVGQPISQATTSIAQLAALYGEDILDTFKYLGLTYINLPHIGYYGGKAVHSTNPAYAGNGRGLCVNYTVPHICREQRSHLPNLFMLAISYTHTSLTASLARTKWAEYIEEYDTISDLTLGYDALHDSANEDLYWEKVRNTLMFPILSSLLPRNIVTTVLVYGDASDEPRFRQILKNVTDDIMEQVPEVLDADPIYSAAKGVAEFAKRVMNCSDCGIWQPHGEVERLDL